MAIEARCGKCKKKVKVKDELAGKKIKCPGCGAAIAIPAAEEAEENPDDGNSSESILNLNLDKFKHKEIDTEDEDFQSGEIEGAVALRRKREQAVKAGPPKEPLQPVDWVLCLLFSGFCLIYPIVLLVQGQRSRGLKALGLSAGMMAFLTTVAVLFYFAIYGI
jgi:hypothetical protein